MQLVIKVSFSLVAHSQSALLDCVSVAKVFAMKVNSYLYIDILAITTWVKQNVSFQYAPLRASSLAGHKVFSNCTINVTRQFSIAAMNNIHLIKPYKRVTFSTYVSIVIGSTTPTL